jgi:pimeloyl-ACP methyl ester carboxylesterase
MKFFKILFIVLFVVFILFSIIPYFFSVEIRELATNEKPFINSYFFTINKTTFHYRVWAPKNKATRKVLLIHGFSGSIFSYRKNIDTLVSQGALIVAIDLPAFGFSDKSDTANYGIENTFEAINKITSLYDTACADKFIVVGHSMGAAVAGVYASNFPKKVKSVILIDGAPFQNSGGGWLAKILFGYPPLKRWANVLTKHYFAKPEKFKELVSSAYHEPADTSAANGYLRPFLYKNSGSAIFKMATADNNFVFNTDGFKNIPLLIIWGKNDNWLPISLRDNFIKKFPETKTYTVANAGHCPMETKAAEVNKVLVEFIFK